jgi:hypothetical protein
LRQTNNPAIQLFANHGVALAQELTIGVRLPFVALIAERMSQFVCDGKVTKPVDAARPFPDQLRTSSRDWRYHCLVKKRLAPAQEREGRAVGIHAMELQERLPVLRLHEDPGPVAKTIGAVFCQEGPEDTHLFVTLLNGIPNIANELLLIFGDGLGLSSVFRRQDLRGRKLYGASEDQRRDTQLEFALHGGTSSAPRSVGGISSYLNDTGVRVTSFSRHTPNCSRQMVFMVRYAIWAYTRLTAGAGHE